MQLIDTHVHINFDTFQTELDAVCARWREAGVVQLVHSCVEPSEFESIRSLADRFAELSFAVGLHPLDADKWTEEMAREIRTRAASDDRVVAIGETGLDFFKAENAEQQYQALHSQLEIARDLDLPVIVHCRDAAKSMVGILRQFQEQHGDLRGVMHCWTGNAQETQWFVDLGFYISFSGVATFKKATQVHEAVRVVPDDRLLVETDCPFLAPAPKRGKRNEPAYVRYVAERVADLRGVPLETLAAQTTSNARTLFGLKSE
ncbi:MAG: TatD family hydrolase [Cyanobacteriota bacterium]|nr:TatD family hydrolase [Cyanobacteriota bacterium]